ncbi:Uncharacterized protein TCM_018549 [Theobroma cacao]|uniref:Secreted protein n=1 Tax=Theobroma cacao TaxID=3641 RepID=A0A061EMB0_THECC|nr:Uncharacterized protein TCM_018549 [Theobroma cacao]
MKCLKCSYSFFIFFLSFRPASNTPLHRLVTLWLNLVMDCQIRLDHLRGARDLAAYPSFWALLGSIRSGASLMCSLGEPQIWCSLRERRQLRGGR